MPENKDNNGEILPAKGSPDSAAESSAELESAEAKTAETKPAATEPVAAEEKVSARRQMSGRAQKSGRAEKAVRPEKAVGPEKRTRSQKGNRRAVRRRWPAIVAGVATAAVAVAVVGAGSLFPGVDATAVTDPVPHVLPVGESMANCQGPTQLLAGSAAGADPEFSANASSTKSALNAVVLSGSTGDLPGAQIQSLDGKFSTLHTVSKAPATPAATPSATPTALTGAPQARAQVLRGTSVNAPSVLRLDPLGEASSVGTGSVVVDASDGDLAGLAAATCQAPANELWLTGASTSVGRTAILMLSNSSQSPATVSLDLFGSDGPVQATGSKGLVVAPGTVRSVVLSGLAPDQELLSVQVKSVGGPVSAVIQQSILRGLTPGGIDYLAPVQAPATSLAIPGVQVRAAADAAKITAQKDYADANTVLAVTVPGMSDAVLEVRAFGADGQVALPNGGVFTAAAGKVSTLSLAGLPAGSYSLAMSADAPVAAAVRLSNFTKEGDAVDLALAPSTARLGDTHVLTLPEGVQSSLVFAAVEGSATIKLVPISASGVLGEGKDVELRAGTSVAVDPAKLLGSGTVAVMVSASGAPAFGSQVLLQDGSAGIAVLPLAQSVAGTQAVNIITRY
ncbi:DUF5719 family protein [Specibacter sp. NPDC078692]|uniref:DUF5719 family protein n=1 Tax=Specibacter sp. NPDC078692 TaxID=3155818 RepID=UPI003428F516